MSNIIAIPSTRTSHRLADQDPVESNVISTDSNFSSAAVDDAAIQAAMQPWLEIECVQLGGGRQLANVDALVVGNRQLVRESQIATVQKLGITPADYCTVSYTTPGQNMRFSEFASVGSGTVFFMPGNTEFDIYVPEGIQTTYLGFSQEEFIHGARALNPEGWDSAPDQLCTLDTAQHAALNTAVNVWFGAAGANADSAAPLDARLFSESLLSTTLLVVAGSAADKLLPGTAERARAFYTYRSARNFIEESFASGSVPNIVQICLSVGVSERALQYAFRTCVDMTPLTYLRLCRLSRVRSSLRAADPQTNSVTDIAMSYGFLHLGRFALDYKRVFGESPSVTLAS